MCDRNKPLSPSEVAEMILSERHISDVESGRGRKKLSQEEKNEVRSRMLDLSEKRERKAMFEGRYFGSLPQNLRATNDKKGWRGSVWQGIGRS